MYPAKYDEVKKSMSSLLHSVVYNEFIFEPSIAYTNDRSNEMNGTIYKVFVNNKDVEFSRFLYMHECGHILFGHTKNMDQRMNRFLLAKITMAYNKLSRFFPDYKTYLIVFRTVLFNVVMDFEVNSRLFSKEEWDFMNERLVNLIHKKGATGMWPEDYGYEIGLTWNEYLNLILMDPEKFFKNFRMQYLNPSIGLNASRKDCKPVMVNIPAKLDENELKRLKTIHEQHEKGTFRNSKDRESLERKAKGDSQEGEKQVDETLFEEYHNMDELFKFLSKVLIKKAQVSSKRDILFNYNRRKHGGNIIVPKEVKEEVKIPANLYILMDVSSSVNLELITSFLKVFRGFQHIFKNTTFIAWNVSLVGEWNIKEDISFQYGGGTCIGAGIEYVKQKYNPKTNDVFFVISDFQDYLEYWKQELLKHKCRKYAINWLGNKVGMNLGFKKVFQYAA